MNVREKLVEQKIKGGTESICPKCFHNKVCKAMDNQPCIECTQFFDAHGVTVQERKPLEAFLRPIDAYKGLKAKYLVFKADTGEQVVNCFVLRPDKDTAAVEALSAYARNTDNETLAEDIYNWIGKGEPVQEWISVEERLPKKTGRYLTTNKRANDEICVFDLWFDCGEWYIDENDDEFVYKVTHWRPLPQPPKGE